MHETKPSFNTLRMLGTVFAIAVIGDAFILAAAILVFPEGRRALLSPHADALAVAFSVAGLALLDGRRRNINLLAVVAFLFALAMGTKVTSLSGCAAACVFLFRHERR